MGIIEKKHENTLTPAPDDDAQSVTSVATGSTMIQVDMDALRKNQQRAHARGHGPWPQKTRCRTGGKRGSRREENSRELQKTYDEMRKDDLNFELEYVEHKDTKFTMVLEDAELRKTWQVFSSLPGDAQDRFIRYIDRNNQNVKDAKQARTATAVTVKRTVEESCSNDSAIDGLDESFTFIDTDGEEVDECDRLREARLCYMNLQKKVRVNMRKQGLEKVPFTYIDRFEKAMLGHFADITNVEQLVPYIEHESNPYFRTWVHRICDYYSLASATENNVIKVRHTSSFKVPTIGFSEFLTKIL